MSFEFQSTLYHNQDAMCAAIAYEWMTAGGANSPDQVTELLSGRTAEALADEAIITWGLGCALEQDDSETWMQHRDITRDDIVTAFRYFIADRPDVKAAQADAE